MGVTHHLSGLVALHTSDVALCYLLFYQALKDYVSRLHEYYKWAVVSSDEWRDPPTLTV